MRYQGGVAPGPEDRGLSCHIRAARTRISRASAARAEQFSLGGLGGGGGLVRTGGE